MKVYVDEFPTQCLECCLCGKDEFGYWCQQSKESVVYISDETVKQKRLQSCPLLSIADYTKQVRKEVCEEIRELAIKRNNDQFYIVVDEILDQIQGEDK